MLKHRLVVAAWLGFALFAFFGKGNASDSTSGQTTMENDSKTDRLTAKDVDNMMSDLSNWGRWGKDDQLGTLNFITPEARKRAAKEVREGVAISIARNAITQKESGSPPFEHKMVRTGQDPNAPGSDDAYAVQYHGFTQTHLDALCHLFYKGKMYNGFSQQDVTENGASKLSVINMKNGLFVRAVLVDIPRLKGVKYLKGRVAIYPKDLDAWLTKTRTRLHPGDAILIRTGRWARRDAEGAWEIEKGSAGLDASCLPWLRKHDVSILGSDLASDVLPSGVDGVFMPIHQAVIIAMGTPIIDNCDFDALSEAANARKRWSFLLTAAPLAVEGGTGSPINPIAIF
jgi:kynurenine formamidase